MAGPQKENGYTAIANEILEQIAKVKLNPTQYRIIFIVWRYTYGFNRKKHDLSLGFLSKATGCDKRQLQRELKNLEEMNIIKQDIKNGKSREVSFNKNYDKWVVKTVIGEIVIGETTIGEIDNGGIVNTTIGETVKGGIGEIDNQERNNLNTNLNTNIYSDFTTNINLIQTLKDFDIMRSSLKNGKMTDKARTMLLNNLNKIADTDEKKIAILEQSIFNNWKGVFPLKEPTSNKSIQQNKFNNMTSRPYETDHGEQYIEKPKPIEDDEIERIKEERRREKELKEQQNSL